MVMSSDLGLPRVSFKKGIQGRPSTFFPALSRSVETWMPCGKAAWEASESTLPGEDHARDIALATWLVTSYVTM